MLSKNISLKEIRNRDDISIGNTVCKFLKQHNKENIINHKNKPNIIQHINIFVDNITFGRNERRINTIEIYMMDGIPGNPQGK